MKLQSQLCLNKTWIKILLRNNNNYLLTKHYFKANLSLNNQSFKDCNKKINSYLLRSSNFKHLDQLISHKWGKNRFKLKHRLQRHLVKTLLVVEEINCFLANLNQLLSHLSNNINNKLSHSSRPNNNSNNKCLAHWVQAFLVLSTHQDLSLNKQNRSIQVLVFWKHKNE